MVILSSVESTKVIVVAVLSDCSGEVDSSDDVEVTVVYFVASEVSHSDGVVDITSETVDAELELSIDGVVPSEVCQVDSRVDGLLVSEPVLPIVVPSEGSVGYSEERVVSESGGNNVGRGVGIVSGYVVASENESLS